MRWLKFTADGTTSWGIIEQERVIAIVGDPFGEWERSPRNYPLADVKIELPLVPRTFYCVGLNYLKHLKEAADKAGTIPNIPDRPEIGYRAQNALIAHDEDVVIPRTATEKIHYEGELVVVIGKKVKHLSEADAMSCVFGYTIGNDDQILHALAGRRDLDGDRRCLARSESRRCRRNRNHGHRHPAQQVRRRDISGIAIGPQCRAKSCCPVQAIDA